jgi:hypothetical protein
MLNEKIDKLSTSDSKIDKIVLAFYNDNKKQLIALKSQSGISSNLWNAMKSAVEY